MLFCRKKKREVGYSPSHPASKHALSIEDIEKNHRGAGSDGTPVASTKAITTLNSFKFALQLLQKAPVPAIGIATAAVLQVISGIQDMSQVEAGFQRLAKRTKHLSFLVSQIQGVVNQSGELCAPLIEELEELKDDIERAAKQGNLSAFFNSTDDKRTIAKHCDVLDDIIIDLTATICVMTHRTAIDIRKDLQRAISQVHIESNDSYGVITKMTNNVADGIDGPLATDNKVYGKAIMNHEIHGNTFGHVGGAMLSNNVVDNMQNFEISKYESYVP